jgi:broad specificity phosphatase PhoE
LTKFILVRHGETEWNKIRRIQGSASDTPLSENGLRQAKGLGLRLKVENIDAIYSSPLQRAMQTAEAIAKHHNLKVMPLPELKEINAGELEGIMASELKMRFDELICRSGPEKGLLCIPGGESVLDVQKRSWETIGNIYREHPQGSVVVVTHYFVIMTVVCRVLNLSLTEITRLRLSNGTVTAFTLDGNDRTSLELFNDACHNAIT